jgi:hypothetical protein
MLGWLRHAQAQEHYPVNLDSDCVSVVFVIGPKKGPRCPEIMQFHLQMN